MESHGLSVNHNVLFDAEYRSLFSTNHDHSNNIMPLWSRSLQPRYENPYLHFEIIDKGSESDLDSVKDVSYRERYKNVQKSLCHLCNIEVPLGYMKMHQISDKHKTFVKITEIALERVKKQLNMSYTSGEVLPSMYFCESCVKLIPDKEKKQHLNSKHHKNSLFIDKLYDDFSKLYSDDVDTESDEIISSKSSIVNTDGTDKINKEDTDKDSKTIIQEEIKTDSVRIKKKPATNVYVKKHNDVTPKKRLVSKKMTVSLDEKLIDLIDKVNTDMKYKIDYLDGDHIIIETEDGIRIRLKHENFHSFFVLGKNHVQCKLCCTISRDVKGHMFSKEHLDKLMLPVDKNCIRKLEDSKGHCMVCNELVENPEIHGLCDKNHDNLLMQALLFEDDGDDDAIEENTKAIEQTKNDENKTLQSKKHGLKDMERFENNTTNEDIIVKKKDTDSKYFCNVCYVTIYRNDITAHCKNSKHQSNVRLEYHYLLDYSYTLRKLKCIVCKTFFSVDALREHFINTQHSSAYDALLAANYLKKSSKNVFCELCILYMRIGNELVHIESPGHIALARAKEKTTAVSHLSAGEINKNVKKSKKPQDNNVSVKETSKLIKENKDNVSSVIENNNSLTNTVQKQTLCKVCDVTIFDSPSSIKQHLVECHQIEDAKHVIENSKMKLVGNVFICENCCEYVSIEDEFKHLNSPTHIVKSLSKVTIDKSDDKTIIDNIEDKTTKDNIENKTTKDNIEDKTTKDNIEDKMSKDNIKDKISKDNIKDKISKDNIKDKISKDSVVIKTNAGASDDKNDTVTDHNKDDKNKLPSIAKVYPKPIDPNRDHFKMDKNGQLICLICTTKVPKGLNSMSIHDDGKRHINNYNVLISNNNIIDKNDDLECTICCVRFERFKLISHIKSNEHLKGGHKKTAVTITYCDVCKKYITTEMATHVLSAGHRSREIKKNVASFVCHVCDVLLTSSESNIKEHKEGTQHSNNVRVLEANTVIVCGDKCYCETCDIEFTFKMTRQHITTSQHLILMGNDVPL